MNAGVAALPRRMVRTAGAELAVAELGAGPAVVVLHGFTGSADSMLALAEPLSAERRVVLPDLAGHGRSSVPDPAGFTMDACVEQVLAVLDELGLGAEPVDLAGYSMGGRVALSLACRAPDRVGRLVTIGAGPGIAEPAEREARAAADRDLARRIRSEGIERFVDEWSEQPLFASQRRLPGEVRTAIRAQRLASDPEGLARSLEGMGTGAMPPLHDELRRLEVPALFLAGEDDPKFVAIAREMAVLAPQGQAAVVPGAGHAAHLEAPGEVARLVSRFLGG